MRVLVTGARGFVGSHALRALVAAGFEVHAVSRGASGDAHSAVQCHRGDLLVPGFPAAVVRAVRPTHLLHLAWETTHGTYWSSPANVQWTEASLALARAFFANGGRRMVGVGTCAEYDWSDGVCDEETTTIRPATLYGQAKAALADALRSHDGFTWARLFFVYGSGEAPQRLVPSVASALLRGEVARCTAGEQRRDFIHVADCASALVRLLEAEKDGAFNVATGTAVPVKDVVRTIAAALHAEDRVAFGALPDREDEAPLVVGVADRLKALGWSPAYDLRTGIEEALERQFR
jgi:nucleoside-diphosphate-sugar epimerase